jgi:hypothetical protein
LSVLARRALAATFTLVIALACAGSASAAELLRQRVTVDQSVDASCMTSLRTGGAGYVQRQFTVPATGQLVARLRGGAGAGDWDLAVFRRGGGEAVAASAYAGADEVAGGYGFRDEQLTVQACRRSGRGSAADLVVELAPIDTSPQPATATLAEVATPTAARKRQLTRLGLDLTEHGGKDFVAVVLHGPGDGAKLRGANFQYRVEVPDLVAQSAKDRAADRRYAASTKASALPSGRTGYRRLADYSDEMKQLVKDNPDLVKPITLPFKTYEGRPVEGIEITTDPNARDGKPVFLQMGAHHAREWPSAEHAMEWAYELINGYRAGSSRTKPLVESTRTIVIPVVNPDGFNASREAGELQGGGPGRGTPNAGQDDETANIVAHPNEYRRKNCRFADDSEGGSCAQPAFGLASGGVDPNRNYGSFWGGPGASGDPTNETYYGPGPFSEPETRNVRDLISHRQVVTLITNHTFSNLVLRPPGLQVQGATPDEPIYKALGQAMTDENGYSNDFSYQLYDTTGTTEDWSYYATGGLGFTFEIGCLDKDATTHECKTGHFHPPFAEMVKEYEGQTTFSDAGGRDGKGNREAYFKAQESTADASKHAVLTGTAPGGAILRLKKEFDTPTSQKNADGTVRTFKDTLDSTLRVPGSGKFEWNINQSTRPLVAKDRGRNPTAPPSAPQTFTGGPTGPPADGAAPGGDANTTNPLNYNEHPITVPADGDNATATIRIEWATPSSDWDMKVYRDNDGSGTVTNGDVVVGASEQGTTDFEQTTLAEPELAPGRKYVVRVTNFAATEPYDGTIAFGSPSFQAAQKESWTLTCESNEGQVFKTEQLTIDRGERKSVDFTGCGLAAGGKDKREKPRVKTRMSVRPKGRLYVMRVSGSLLNTADRGNPIPTGSKASRCAGTVKIAAKLRRQTLAVGRARVTPRCKFVKTIKFRRANVGRKRLRSVSRYNGSKYLLPARKTASARVKRR